MKIFLYISVYSCHLFLISSAAFRSIQFLSFIVPIFAWNVPLVSVIFLKRSVISFCCFLLFLCIVHLRNLFFISPCYSLELCIQLGIFFPFSLPFTSFLSCFKDSSNNHFPFLQFSFFGMVLVTASSTMLWTSIHSSSGVLSDLIPWIICLSLPLYNHKGFDLGHPWMV